MTDNQKLVISVYSEAKCISYTNEMGVYWVIIDPNYHDGKMPIGYSFRSEEDAWTRIAENYRLTMKKMLLQLES
jgi:hypothetical protein